MVRSNDKEKSVLPLKYKPAELWYILNNKLCFRHMLLLEKNINLYNYQGKLVASPRWSNMKPEGIRQPHISISNDTLAVRDASDGKSTYYVALLCWRFKAKDRSCCGSYRLYQSYFYVLSFACSNVAFKQNIILTRRKCFSDK